MLREFKHVKQEPGAGKRRWWGGDGLEFTVWYDEGEQFTGFQLCYRGRAFTWQTNGYWSHVRVGTGIGELGGRGYSCPILQANGVEQHPPRRLAQDFERAADGSVAEQIRELVSGVLSICAR